MARSGLAAGVRAGSVIAEMSTLAIKDKIAADETLSPLGVTVLDAPISGTAIQAETGDIVVYASGESSAIVRLGRALTGAARDVIDVGAFGNGTRFKLLANQLVAIHVVAAGEVLAVARRCGLDLAEVVGILAAGAGGSRMLEVRGPLMVDHRYEPASMPVGLFEKDLRLIAELAEAVGASVPLFESAATRFHEAAAGGAEDLDTAVVHEVSLTDPDARPFRRDPKLRDRSVAG
jgi:3-hydroxyisobutyrate dehydrogenase-like beta-hydroxyacid dehydrogenase